ncbi:MAG: hypothetical protein K2I92_06135 [Muribaculaceae bacterium]|nr:hypothetical protein [Muribaculaceae bacterium]
MTELNNPEFGSAKLGRKALKDAVRILEGIGRPHLSKAQENNIKELAKALGMAAREIKPMSFSEADQGASNPSKDQNNCQSCVVSFAARRRGLDCKARPYDFGNDNMCALGERFQDAWIDSRTGDILNPIIIRGKDDEDILNRLRKCLSAEGEYILGFNGKDDSGHVVNVISINGEIIIHDEQISRNANRYSSLASFSDIDYFELIKVDKALLNVELVKEVLEAN